MVKVNRKNNSTNKELNYEKAAHVQQVQMVGKYNG